MTVQDTTRRAGPYAGTGAQTDFPFTFKAFATTDVRVVLEVDGIESDVSPGSCTVTLNANQETSPGGTVSFLAAPVSGASLVILSDVAYDQPLALPGGGNFPPRSVEQQFDRVAMQLQQIREEQDRTLMLPATVGPGVSAVLPPPQAGAVVGWDEAGTALRNIDPATLASIIAYSNRRVLVADGGAASYSLDADPGVVANTLVVVSGVVQTPGVDYTLSGTTLTPAATFPAGTGNVVILYGQALPVGTVTSDIVTHSATGTGAVARTVQTKLRDSVSVKDFGATGDGTTDDTAAIQACIDANPGRVLMLPVGTYRVTGTLSITADGTALCGMPSARGGYSPMAGSFGVTILQTAANVDTVVFQPATSGTSSIRGVTIRDVCIRHATSVVDTNPTSGIGLRIRRASTYYVEGVTVVDAYEPVVIQGGSDGKIDRLSIHTYYGTAVAADTAMLSFRSDLAGATFQGCYTAEVSNLYINGTKKRQHAIWVASSDGIHVNNAYVAGAAESLLRLRNIYDGGAVGSADSIAALSFSNTYFDCVTNAPTATLGTKHGIKIEEDGNTNTRIYSVVIGSGCFIGNSDNHLITGSITKAAPTKIVVSGATLSNGLRAVNLSGPASSQVDVHLSACQIESCSEPSAGVVAVSNLRELVISNCGWLPLAGPCLGMTGTIGQAALTGNNNTSTRDDLVSTATVNSLTLAGNNSASTNAAATWRGLRTANQTSNDPRVLDHYLEAAWTPTITLGGATTGITYTVQSGTYTRVGDRITFDARITLSSKGTATGNLQITGLPISAVGDTPISARITSVTAGVLDRPVFAFVQGGSTAIRLDKVAAAGATGPAIMTDADLSGTFSVMLSGSYKV